MQEFSMFEDADQMVCLEIISGMLDTGFSVDVTVSTQQVFSSFESATLGTGELASHNSHHTRLLVSHDANISLHVLPIQLSLQLLLTTMTPYQFPLWSPSPPTTLVSPSLL